MIKQNVAVLCGGYTAEQNISMMSGNVVEKNIDTTRYNVYKVVVEKDGWYVSANRTLVNMSDFSFMENGAIVKFDIAFVAIHGSPGEDGKIQGYLDMIGIPYTNCGVLASSITFNKNICKSLLKDLQIPMAKGLVINKYDDVPEKIKTVQNNFALPLFVKPNNNGSSYGVSKIKNFEALTGAIMESFQFDTEVLIEEGITGTEVTCGVYMHNKKIIVLPICEIVSGKHDFFDYTAKYTTGESDEIIPARISAGIADAIKRTSSAIYLALGCRGVVRIDYIINEKNDDPYFLEVNTVPGLSENSIVPKMARASGLTLSEFFNILIEESL